MVSMSAGVDVSLQAMVTSPAQRRLDRWHGLETAAQQLTDTAQAGLDLDGSVEAFAGLLDELESYERFWLFPGQATLQRIREYLAHRDVQLVRQFVSRAVHRMSEFGDGGSLFDLALPLAQQPPDLLAGARRFVTVLIADDTPEDVPQSVAEELRRLELDGHELAFGLLVVGSVEEALAAVALNDEIQACIIRRDLTLRASSWTSLLEALVHFEPGSVGDRAGNGIRCGRWIRQLRPHLDLYLLTDESVAARDPYTQGVFARTFYRLNEEAELRAAVLAGIRRRYATPFFDALRRYAAAPIGQFHALPVARGASIFNSRWLQDMGEFYGRNIFLAETSSTSGGLDSLLDPRGTVKQAMDKAAITFGARETYFVTNGTSTANKVVLQALTRPGDIVLIDRNCHKSHHYGLMLSGARPLYLDAYPLQRYAIYGGVPLRTIKQTLLELKAAGRLDQVRMVLLTNCTFDGITYNPTRVMEEVLAIKPDMCFLWDEAWYAFAIAVPFARGRTAMDAAARLSLRLGSDAYRAEYQAWRATMADVPESDWADHRLLPDPNVARVRVYATHSTHKSLSALRQGSMIHVWDQDFDRDVHEQFSEAYLTHTSTSPNQQLVASLDLARRQVDLEGYRMVRNAYQMALAFRYRVKHDPLLRRWYRVLDQADLVPAQYRPSGATSYLRLADPDSVASYPEWDQAWADDEFVLDPTRVTLYLGRTGMSGFEFRERILMDRFGIQINKTSLNSVLLIFTIGVTWSSVQYLLDVLRRIAVALAKAVEGASHADRVLMGKRTRVLTSQLPPLPDFSAFDPAFRPSMASPEGDLRAAFYAAYDEANREYVPLADAPALLARGRTLVSATFVVPYPPGFPVLVPGQVVSAQILTFLTHLDIPEVHGYRAELGLSVFTERALQRFAEEQDRPRQTSRSLRPATRGTAEPSVSPAGPGSPRPDGSDRSQHRSDLSSRVARAIGEGASGDVPITE
ncbi:MAG: aminotransferase class I/II-fold pyridoxal phosphate-dependent enzyme [Intrasporangium sp.]|uniref:aminotransferase class I/II-fold pyridoxal phosphate-dependent enzyme n=1 Tax=Intrasporangium sp. TaxID=1925024 RepID=UPI0026498D71|nr:aminotransferase class I/II-fold pyridoxal phosphate-dependent enzyme [Intrasporangium sp.]MDN5795519.1 aminotransferase class I/II-fold pyridoxal phosphate-dependent enzyme [Intrasporangium sp.]